MITLKDKLSPGNTLTLIRHDLSPYSLRLNQTRKIAGNKHQALMFEGGDWIPWPAAKDVTMTEAGFNVELEPGKFMSYEFGETK